MEIGSDEFKKYMEELEKQPREPFKPHWWYNRHGDMIEAYFSNEGHIAHWINPQLTILYSVEEPTKVVGVILEGIKKGIHASESVS